MANISNEMKRRVEFLTRELAAKNSVTSAVLRCMGETLLAGGRWATLAQMERERQFVNEMEDVLDALDYIVKRIWPAE